MINLIRLLRFNPSALLRFFIKGIEKGAKTKKYLEERINLFITWKKMYVDIVPLNTSRKGQYKETIFCVKHILKLSCKNICLKLNHIKHNTY